MNDFRTTNQEKEIHPSGRSPLEEMGTTGPAPYRLISVEFDGQFPPDDDGPVFAPLYACKLAVETDGQLVENVAHYRDEREPPPQVGETILGRLCEDQRGWKLTEATFFTSETEADPFPYGCPKCGVNDGVVNIGSSHLFYCIEHQNYWHWGAHNLSSWRYMSLEEQLRIYDEVKLSSNRVAELGPRLHYRGNELW
jgi:hypothetical protein